MDERDTPKARAKSWATGEDVKLLGLFDQGIVDPETPTDIDSLEAIRQEHFSHIPYRNFRNRFMDKSANYITNQNLTGANTSNMPSATTKQSVTNKKQAAAAALKKSPAGAGAVDDVADGMDNLAIGKKSSGPYSFDSKFPWVLKGPYLKTDKDKMELEFACAPYYKESLQAKLTKGGNVCSVRAGIPDFFAEEKRLRLQMGDRHHADHPRVIAHKDVVQKVREECTKESGDKYYGKVEQEVDLPVQCEGVPSKMFSYIPYGWVEKPADAEPLRMERHSQFLLVVTLVFDVAKKRIKKEKRGIELVCAALSEDSDDADMNA